MDRRQILRSSLGLVGAAALTPWLPGAIPAVRAEGEEVDEQDRVMGAAEAPVTMIEYSSLTCPHCASFHKNTLPTLESEWIEAGKMRLVFRHFPLDGLALRAAAVANCLEGERFFTFVEALFRSQERWARASDPVKALGNIAKVAGLDDAAFTACVEDEAEMNRILERAREGARVFEVQSTPTFVINGRKVTGAVPLEEFEKVLDEASSS